MSDPIEPEVPDEDPKETDPQRAPAAGDTGGSGAPNIPPPPPPT